MKRKIVVGGEEELKKVGERLAKGLLFPVVVELVGDVGVGKTTFTKGLAKGLGVKEEVVSPTFAIVNRYEFAGGELIHYDFYRLEDAGIMEEDLREVVGAENKVVVVEWSDVVVGILPKERVRILIDLMEDGKREIEIEGNLKAF